MATFSQPFYNNNALLISHPIFQASLCCGYGADGKNTAGTKAGYDCVTIPGAVKNNAIMTAVPERICGRKFVTVGGATMVSVTVCSK